VQWLRLEWFAAVVVAVALSWPIGASAGSSHQDQRRTVVVEVNRGGFQWGDAGIGAAGACAIGLVVGGVLALRHRPNEIDQKGVEGA
jgi:hypothetical protein